MNSGRMVDAAKRRWAHLPLLVPLAFAATSMWHPAQAAHRIRLGVAACEGPRSTIVSLGDEVAVEACYIEEPAASGTKEIFFVVSGGGETDRVAVTTGDTLKAAHVVSSQRSGARSITACDRDACSAPVTVRWSGTSDAEEPATSRPPHIGEGGTAAEGKTSPIAVPAAGDGFACDKGPGSSITPIFGFASVIRAEAAREPDGPLHPRTSLPAGAVLVDLGQHFQSGALASGVNASLFVALAEDGPLDRARGFPFRGFNRLFVFWTTSTGGFGKRELAFADGSWRDVAPSFTFAITHQRAGFHLDSGTLPERFAVGAQAGAVCDSIGFPSLGKRSVAEKVEGFPGALTLATGIGVLLLLAVLASAVLKSGEPPARGVTIEAPSGPLVRAERSDIRFDTHGRARSYVDIVELPDGTTRTIRAEIQPQGLIVDRPDFIDPIDWEDESIFVERSLTSSGHKETIKNLDGDAIGVEVTDVHSDDNGRVIGYHRAMTLAHLESVIREESLMLKYDEPASSSPKGKLVPSSRELVKKHQIRYDDESHVAGYMAEISTIHAGVEDIGEVPAIMFELGEGWPSRPIFTSSPNSGLARTRNILTRWFRLHGCKVALTLRDETGKPLPDVRLRVGAGETHTDHRGSQTLWIMKPGVYAVSVDPSLTSSGSIASKRLIAWLVVQDIPGHMIADCRVPDQESVTAS